MPLSHSEPRGAGAARTPRWHVLYYILAGFDLLTVVVSLLLSHQVSRLYAESVRANQRWADRFATLNTLSEAAGRVNAPGNDVFETHDAARERVRFDAANAAFERLLAEVQANSLSVLAVCHGEEYRQSFQNIRESMAAMRSEAERIFDHFSKGESELAGGRMAAMDRRYAEVNAAINRVQNHAREAQRDALAAQFAQARALRHFEYVLAGSILLMIVGVTVYGHRLSTAVRAAEYARRRGAIERESLEHALMDASRRAGMAEVATGLLHNIGNVLNSVQASTSVAQRTAGEMRTAQFRRATELMRAQGGALGQYLSDDEKGRQLPGYLDMLSEAMAEDQQALIRELDHLARGLDHVKNVIGSQQRMAKNSTMVREVSPKELFEDAVRFVSASHDFDGVTLRREFEPIAAAMLDQHRVLQILVNLLTNAGKAMRDTPAAQRRITLRIAAASDATALRFEVQDNGVGISREQLASLFSHGFTTRPDGHGFGLHSAANAANEMGGALTAESDGPGRGARFTLQLPLRTPLAARPEQHRSAQPA
ncbi:MAG: ATP-binding protein [Phycisphaerae bacterium]|nr:ATP-binding protein [Phycisphaerae bacterium]